MKQTQTQSSGVFDRFAATSSQHISKAWFFALCCLSIVVWAATGPLFDFNDTWQLIINTGTTVITFLLVALIQNTQDRSTRAITHKLDAIAEGLAYLLENEDECDVVDDLREMAGVEMEPSQ